MQMCPYISSTHTTQWQRNNFVIWGPSQIKVLSFQHRNSHFEDETVSRPPYPYNGDSHLEGYILKYSLFAVPESKVNGANMGPTWVLSAPGGPHVGPMNLAIWGVQRWQPLRGNTSYVLERLGQHGSPLISNRITWHPGHVGANNYLSL